MDLVEKKAFFKEFALDDAVEDESEDLDEIEISRLATHSKFSKSGHARAVEGVKASESNLRHNIPASLRKTVSLPEPSLSVSDPPLHGDNPSRSTSHGAKSARVQDQSRNIVPSNVMDEIKTSSKCRTKRKRDESVKLLPDSRQYLKGFSIFFIRNNDTNPVRKIQIRKAIEHGAVWVKDWTAGITHVVADSDLTFDDVTTWIKKNCVDPIPSHIAFVNHEYAPDCIRFQYQLNPRQPQYYIKGYKELSTAVATPKTVGQNDIQGAIANEESREPPQPSS